MLGVSCASSWPGVRGWRPLKWCKSPGPPRRLSQLGGCISGDWLRLVLQEVGRSVSLVRVPPQPDELCPRPIVPHLIWPRLGALVKAQQQGTLEMRLAQYAKPKLLIIDELGYLPLEPAAGHLFFQLISRRYEQGSVLISSNRPVDEWDEVFGDQVVAAAILDRLLHHSHVVTIRGDSYRLRRPEG